MRMHICGVIKSKYGKRGNVMKSDIKKMYDNRFDEKMKKQKDLIWMEICKYLMHISKRKKYRITVDIAAGYCEFINHFEGGGKKYAMDINLDVEYYAEQSVTAIIDDIENLMTYFKEETVSLFFMSNFLEHISKDMISHLLKVEYSLLEPNGEVWILTPNIRYVGGKYWDFYDHITPITENALIEEATLIGYRVEKCIPRFLPFTTKSRLPKIPWIVGLYLKLMPLSGMVFGEQSFLIFVK